MVAPLVRLLWCLSALLLCVSAALPHGADMRVVFREASMQHHEHRGNGTTTITTTTDWIGCAEPELVPWQFVLAPPLLWCNASTCVSRANRTHDVHAIRCSDVACSVTIHCTQLCREAFNGALITALA